MFYDLEVTNASDAVDIQAFTAERVRAITELSLRQLQYWDERGFLKPSLTARQGRGRKRLYSFGDLVSLKVAGQLRKLGISLQQIRKVDGHLRELDYRNPLAELRFFVSGSVLYFEESGTVRTGRELEQVLASYMVPVGEIAHSLAGQIAQLHERRPGEIERRRGTLGGQPVIKGTRIAVASIKRLAADGAGQAEILDMYPDLTPADVKAALATETPPRRSRRAS
jgi:uncharacterized protein (DUF433 family)